MDRKSCPNGHQWQDFEECKTCPICGAEAAETIGGEHSEHESTQVSSKGTQSTDPGEADLSRFGRYQIVDELGHGGMGIVYRAFDPVHQRQVALKSLPNTDATLLSRFKREFRMLAGLDHPNIVKLFELTSDGETWFFTMEIIDGVDLMSHLGCSIGKRWGNHSHDDADELALTQQFHSFDLTEEKQQRIRDAFSQLADAIATMHASGIVHRDIKPSNVLVTREGRVVLLDFGLVAETDPSGIYQSMHQGVMGTAAYMSPEQAACEAVSAASDWYAVGVMLYQALTGRLPYSGTAVDILFNKQRHSPVPPCEIESTVTREWNDLCMVLLCRNPENRPSAEDILQRLGGHNRPRPWKKAVHTDEGLLVGRESHLQTLDEAWQAVRGGQAKSVFIEGRSGNGKSALVEAFIERAGQDGAVVLKGRCYEMESVPFKAIDGLIDSLVTHISQLPESDAAALMPRDVHALVRLFPVIGQVNVVARMPHRQFEIADQQELNRQAIDALRELLARIGDRFPLVVYIDDLQWGDEDSAAMLSNLLQPPDAPVLMFLGTYRSEDSDTSQFLQSFRQLQRQRENPLQSLHVEVTELAHADAVKLALSLLGRQDADAGRDADAVAVESAGNPFFVSELIKHVQLEGREFNDSAETPSLFDMIWSRVQRLPEDSQRLLTVVAINGQPMPLEQAIQIAGVGQSALGPLRVGHLIRTVGLTESSKIETYHDRVRESLSKCLDPVVKQDNHRRIAEEHVRRAAVSGDQIMACLAVCISDKSAQLDDQLDIDSVWYDIAFHFDAAGRPDLAFPFALATGEKARSQFSLEVAEQQYRIAERGAEDCDNKVKYRIVEGLGDVLMLRGLYPPAAARFQGARLLAMDSLTRARIEGKLGELAFKQGDNKAGIDAMERALRLLRRSVPTRPVMFLPLLVWELFVQTLHSLLPRLFLARRSLQGAEQELLAIDLHVHLTRAYFFERGVVPCLWTHLRSVNLAERFPPTRELGYAWAAHSPVMSLIPWIRRGEMYGKKSLKIRRELGDVCGQGQSLHYLGVVLFVGARFDECITSCGEAVRLLERSGDYWERNMAWWQSANAVFRKGELSRAVSECRRLYEACREIGDDKVAGFSLDVWSRASGGKVPTDVVHQAMELERNDVQATTQVLLAEAVRLVAQDELNKAAEVLKRARQVCRDVGMMNAWVSPVLPWLATVYRLQFQRSAGSAPDRRSQRLKDARRAVRQALKVARKFQTDLPHALREAGLVSAIQGSSRKARRYLDASLDVANRQGARFEHAQSFLARGMKGRKFGWPDAEEEIATAQKILIEMGGDFAFKHITVAE